MTRVDLKAIRRRLYRGYSDIRAAIADVSSLLPMVAALDRRLTVMQLQRVGPKKARRCEPVGTRSCDCGCGAVFEIFNGAGRPRRFVDGHNLRVAPGAVRAREAARRAAA